MYVKGDMSFIKPKQPKAWICSCRRKNAPEDTVCSFCQRPRDTSEAVKAKKQKPYDEVVLWPVFSLYIRLRDSDKQGIGLCFTCGKPKHYTKADCGHGIPRQHKATKYHEQNNHLQCKACNGFQGGMREAYKQKMDQRYGAGTWDKMLIASKGTKKLGKTEVDFLAAHYQKEIVKLLEEKLGLTK